MDLEEQVEGFQGTVALVASVAAAAMTPLEKEGSLRGPRNTHLAQEALSWSLALTLQLHPRKLPRLAAATHS